tara:strand:+ start:2348 stop:3118 length:771 start_codon:yes stop_codon:yes gene_type:complete
MIIPNSCIFYLVNEQEIHVKRLEDSLRCLKDNFLYEYPYPVVFGHEGLTSTTKARIKKSAPANHYFHKVDFTLPPYDEDIIQKIPEKFKGHWDENAFFSMGYRHMCRLFAGGLNKDSFFDKVKYIMRLDCDSYITDKITSDPFKVMADKEGIYGYVGEEEDMDYVVDGLFDLAEKIAPTDEELQYNKMYQTHFFIEDCEWFRTGPYMKFFDEVDKTGNIYIKRWGDAPIKYQGVMRLVPKDKRIKFNLPYRHGGDF